MNTQYFTQRAESPLINSVGQRPTNGIRVCSLRPERAIAKLEIRLTPFQGLGLVYILPFRRALPYANAQKAFSLLGTTLRNQKNY
jgi:hypothetical protein